MSAKLGEHQVAGDTFAAFCALIGSLRACVEEAAAEAVREERRAFAEEDLELYKKLSEINAKVNVTVPEAALLLNCSDSHLYRLIGEAKKGKRRGLGGVRRHGRLPVCES
jgi:hypothetical protein